MEIGNKISTLRKEKHLSQEELGELVGVARQTISKWELGETSPDIKEAKELAKIFNVTIDELVNNNVSEIIDNRKSNTERLATIILTTSKIILALIIFFLVILLPLKIYRKNHQKNIQGREIEESIYCKIYGEEHGLTIKYYENSDLPIEFASDSYFDDILHLGKYDYAHQIFNIINDYVKKNGGSCERIEEHDLNNLINIQIKEGTLTKTGATIIISENIDYDIIYGEPFWIEKYNYKTSSFEKLANTTGKNCAFNLPAYHAKPDTPLELKQDWSCDYGELSKGLYRLVKEASFESDRPITEEKEFYLWVEFEIK